MPLHPAWAKNVARRVLAATISPEPDRKHRPAISSYFDDRCAYCGTDLPAKWHLDHLLSFDLGGSNHLSNRVPACPPCNEDEKRDMAWVTFLRHKCLSEAQYAQRLAKIEGWRAKHGGGTDATVSDAARAAYTKEVQLVSAAIDEAYARLKAARS